MSSGQDPAGPNAHNHAPEPASWFEVVSSQTRYDGIYSRVRVDDVRQPDGRTTEREVVEQLPAAAVIPLLDGDQVVLLRQYRHPVGAYLLEIPAGKLDREGESPRDCAARELTEETGYRAGELEELITFPNSAGWTDEVTHLFVGRDLEFDGQPESFEASAEEADMEVVTLPLGDALAAVRDGSIVDAKTVIGLLLATS